MTDGRAAAPWLVRRTPEEQSEARIFCLPSVGVGASSFRRWHDEVPTNVDVCAVRFPGRESRLFEPAYDDMQALVDVLSNALAAWLDLPFALVGDCSGGYVMLELARCMRARGLPAPATLVTAACPAPQLPRPRARLHALPVDRMVAELARVGGIDRDLVAEPEMLELVEPTLRADLRLTENWRYCEDAPLATSIVAVGGLSDRFVTPEQLVPWRSQTTGAFSLLLIAGDHFVLTSQPRAAARIVVRALLGDGPGRMVLSELAEARSGGAGGA
jgi:surfactin synthase thioesterase subunit